MGPSARATADSWSMRNARPRAKRASCGGSPREGARSEERAEQRLAAGGRRLPRPGYVIDLRLVLNPGVGVRQVDPRSAHELADIGTDGEVGWYLHQFDVDPHRVVAVVHQVLPQLLG